MEKSKQKVIEEFKKEYNKALEMFCPVCGYYCLGKGAFGCIDKLGYIRKLCTKLEQPTII